METTQLKYAYKEISSPVGTLRLITSDKALIAVLFGRYESFSLIKRDEMAENNNHPLLLKTERQLKEYFDNKRKTFDIPIEFIGSEFQKKVWEALLTIPFGKTKSYGELAKQIGEPDMARAVGGALNKNPIPIIVPCHRVIGATGKLVGFGGGLQNKTILLDLERPVKQTTLWK